MNMMVNKVGALPVGMVALAVGAEVMFGGLEDVPGLEMLIVAVAAPLALFLAQNRSQVAAKGTCAIGAAVPLSPQKVAPWRKVDADKGTGLRQPEGKIRSKQQAQTSTGCQKSLAKSRIDSCAKEGKLDEAEAVLSELVATSSADAVCFNM